MTEKELKRKGLDKEVTTTAVYELYKWAFGNPSRAIITVTMDLAKEVTGSHVEGTFAAEALAHEMRCNKELKKTVDMAVHIYNGIAKEKRKK